MRGLISDLEKLSLRLKEGTMLTLLVLVTGLKPLSEGTMLLRLPLTWI